MWCIYDEILEEFGIGRTDFDELKTIVRELGQAQARTEVRLEELAQAQARTEVRRNNWPRRNNVRKAVSSRTAVLGGSAEAHS